MTLQIRFRNIRNLSTEGCLWCFGFVEGRDINVRLVDGWEWGFLCRIMVREVDGKGVVLIEVDGGF